MATREMERAYGNRGAPNRAGAMYLRGNGELIARVPTARYGSEQALYHTQDILGSTMQTFGPGRSVREVYRYTAYGEAYEGSLSGHNEFGYNGKRYDAMSGLYNYGHRDYNPKEGRWTTVDPIRAGSNWYAYVNADPVNFVDPWGLDDFYARYDKNAEKMIATYVPESQGVVDYSNIRSFAWAASNNVEHLYSPEKKTIPTKQNYYPQSFPNGTWDMSKSVATTDTPENNKLYGPRFVGTNANQTVDTYTRQVDPVSGETTYVKSGTTKDTGYGVHGGGYTSTSVPPYLGQSASPTADNDVEDVTLGCIRMKNSDIESFAALSDAAIDSRGVSQLSVVGGKEQ